MRAVLVKSAGLTRACWAARVCKGREGNEERTIHCNEERTIQHWAVSQLLNGNHGNGSHGNGSHGNGSHGSGSHGSGSHGSGMSQRERRAPLLLSSPRPVLKLHTRASRRATGQGRTGDRAQGSGAGGGGAERAMPRHLRCRREAEHGAERAIDELLMCDIAAFGPGRDG